MKFLSPYRTCLPWESIWKCREHNNGCFVQFRRDDGEIDILKNNIIPIQVLLTSIRTVLCAVATAYHTPDLATGRTTLIDVHWCIRKRVIFTYRRQSYKKNNCAGYANTELWKYKNISGDECKTKLASTRLKKFPWINHIIHKNIKK